MCKFCDDLEYKEIKIPNRTSLANDNICNIGSPDKSRLSYSCEKCYGCDDKNNYFSICIFDDTVYLNYYREIKNIIIAPISTRFCINYCPMCGKRISNNIHGDLVFW